MSCLGISNTAETFSPTSAAASDQTSSQNIQNENLSGNSNDVKDNSIKGVASDYASPVNGADKASTLNMADAGNPLAENSESSTGTKIREIINALLKIVLEILKSFLSNLGQSKSRTDSGTLAPASGNLPVDTGTNTLNTPTVAPSAGATTESETTGTPTNATSAAVPADVHPHPADTQTEPSSDSAATGTGSTDEPAYTTPADDSGVTTPTDIPGTDTSGKLPESSNSTPTSVEGGTTGTSTGTETVDTPAATETDGVPSGEAGQDVSDVSGVDVPQTKGDYQLVWDDEFNYEGLPDPQKWDYDTAGNAWSWGNNEAQNYTANDPDNAYVKDGKLNITALKEPTDGKDYSSARLTTKGKGDWQNGRVEVRAKLPEGRGTWPAIWMLPSNNAYGQWPNSGEMDIMEKVGYDPDNVHATMHTGAYNHTLGTQKSATLSQPDNSDQFHDYAIEWDKDEIRAYVDDQQYFTFKKESDDPQKWPFDQPFHLLLNLAVGGDWGGAQGIDDSIFPQSMQVDHVRVYQKNAQ